MGVQARRVAATMDDQRAIALSRMRSTKLAGVAAGRSAACGTWRVRCMAGHSIGRVNKACDRASTPRGPLVRAVTRNTGVRGVETLEQREQLSGTRVLDMAQWLSAAGSWSEHRRSIRYTVCMPSPLAMADVLASAPKAAANEASSLMARGTPALSVGRAMAE